MREGLWLIIVGVVGLVCMSIEWEEDKLGTQNVGDYVALIRNRLPPLECKIKDVFSSDAPPEREESGDELVKVALERIPYFFGPSRRSQRFDLVGEMDPPRIHQFSDGEIGYAQRVRIINREKPVDDTHLHWPEVVTAEIDEVGPWVVGSVWSMQLRNYQEVGGDQTSVAFLRDDVMYFRTDEKTGFEYVTFDILWRDQEQGYRVDIRE